MDVVITEIGGTVGDIESLPFLEAIRQFRNDIGRQNVLYIHVTLIPFIEASRRTQDQAHPAQRQRASRDRYSARHHRVPVGSSASAGN